MLVVVVLTTSSPANHHDDDDEEEEKDEGDECADDYADKLFTITCLWWLVWAIFWP